MEGRPPEASRRELIGRDKVIVTRDTEPHSAGAAHDPGRHCGGADTPDCVLVGWEIEKFACHEGPPLLS